MDVIEHEQGQAEVDEFVVEGEGEEEQHRVVRIVQGDRELWLCDCGMSYDTDQGRDEVCEHISEASLYLADRAAA
jgi:hypothetical protein